MSEDYKMPEVCVGTPVLYYNADGSGDPVTALVVGVGNTTVDLACIHPGSRNVSPQSGVCHKSDPSRQKRILDEQSNGFWDYTPERNRLAVLAERIASIAAEVAKMRTAKGAGDSTKKPGE